MKTISLQWIKTTFRDKLKKIILLGMTSTIFFKSSAKKKKEYRGLITNNKIVKSFIQAFPFILKDNKNRAAAKGKHSRILYTKSP